MICEECAVCGKELVFANMLDYNDAIGKSGPELECEDCRGGVEDE